MIRHPDKKQFLLALLLLFLLSQLEAATLRAAVLPISGGTQAELSGLSTSLEKLLAARLRETGFEVVEPAEAAAWRGLAAQQSERRALSSVQLEVAQQENCRLLIVGSIGLDERNVVLQLRVFDVREKSVLTACFVSGVMGLGAFNLLPDAVAAINEKVDTFFRQESERADLQGAAMIQQLVLSSPDNGAEVLLSDRSSLGFVSGGTLDLTGRVTPLLEGSTLGITLQKEGFFPEYHELVLSDSSQTAHTLPALVRQRVFDFSLWSTVGQLVGAGLGVRWYLIPNTIYLMAENYFYVQANPSIPNSASLYHNDIGLSVGFYVFFPYHSFFRTSLATGGGCILTSIPALPGTLYTDWYINLATITFELDFRSFVIFLQEYFRFSLGLGDNLLGQRYISMGQGAPGVSLGIRFP